MTLVLLQYFLEMQVSQSTGSCYLRNRALSNLLCFTNYEYYHRTIYTKSVCLEHGQVNLLKRNSPAALIPMAQRNSHKRRQKP